MPDLPCVVTQHPIGGLKPDAVKVKAAAMVADTLKAVSEPAAAGHAAEARFAGRR